MGQNQPTKVYTYVPTGTYLPYLYPTYLPVPTSLLSTGTVACNQPQTTSESCEPPIFCVVLGACAWYDTSINYPIDI